MHTPNDYGLTLQLPFLIVNLLCLGFFVYQVTMSSVTCFITGRLTFFKDISEGK